MENMMTTEQEPPAVPTDPEFRYTDKRFMVNYSELYEAARAVRTVLEKHGVRPAESDPSKPAVRPIDLTDDHTGGTGQEARKELVIAVLRAINYDRLGYAEGTIARHKDGRVAKRYYDKMFCCLRWFILKHEQSEEPMAERVDELDRDWRIVHEEPWNIGGKSGEDPPI